MDKKIKRWNFGIQALAWTIVVDAIVSINFARPLTIFTIISAILCFIAACILFSVEAVAPEEK